MLAREDVHTCDALMRLRPFLGKPATPAAFVPHPVRYATKTWFGLRDIRYCREDSLVKKDMVRKVGSESWRLSVEDGRNVGRALTNNPLPCDCRFILGYLLTDHFLTFAKGAQ